MSTIEETREDLIAESHFKAAAEHKHQSRRVISTRRQHAEEEKRQRLRSEIDAQLKTPLKGCPPLRPNEKSRIRERVLAGGLIWRAVGT